MTYIPASQQGGEQDILASLWGALRSFIQSLPGPYRTVKSVVQKDLVGHFCTLLISTATAIHCERHDKGGLGR